MISEKNNNFKVMYDLNLSPTTYDFGHYLVHAEAVRQLTHKNSLIDLTIRADGFRSHTPRDKAMKDDEKEDSEENAENPEEPEGETIEATAEEVETK